MCFSIGIHMWPIVSYTQHFRCSTLYQIYTLACCNGALRIAAEDGSVHVIISAPKLSLSYTESFTLGP